MKWLLFIAALSIGVPVLSYLMFFSRRIRDFSIIAFFILIANNLNRELSINLISYDWYRGSARGIEITGPDLICFSMLLYTIFLPSSHHPRKWFSIESIVFLLFIIYCLFNCFIAVVPEYAFLEAWKFLRGYMIFTIFSLIINYQKQVKKILHVLGLICFYQFCFVFQQKYIAGQYRPAGTFGHMNTLAMMMNLCILPIFNNFILAPRRFLIMLWYFICIGAAVFCVIATLSRGAIISLGTAMSFTAFFINYKAIFRRIFFNFRSLNFKRSILFTLLIVCGIAGSIKASDTLIRRFTSAPRASSLRRMEMNIGARLMMKDFFFGVGLNNYSHMMGETKYGEKATTTTGNKDDGVAHHIYLLTGAELGYPGLFLFVLLISLPCIRALVEFNKNNDPVIKAFCAGIFCGFLALHLQGFLEWILRQTPVWFLFCALSGLLVAITNIRKSESHLKNQNPV